MDADLFEVFIVSRNDNGDDLGDVGALDGANEGCLDGSRTWTQGENPHPVTALSLYALRPFMFSLLISDGFLGSGDVGLRSMDGGMGRISSIAGVGEGADEVEARRNLKGFLALIGKCAVIGRFLTWICSDICGSDNSEGRFFNGGRSPKSDSGDEHSVESPEENEAVAHVVFSLESGWGCSISLPVRTSREKDTCRPTLSRESNGRVTIGMGRGGRRGVR